MDRTRLKILVVDDTKTNIDVLEGILSNDYDVCVALNGKKAIELTEKIRPDLILLDVMMPEMDGYETLRIMREKNILQGIPVIFLTAKADSKSEQIGLDLGAVDYITKPFNPALVTLRIKNQLQLKQQRDHLHELVDEKTGKKIPVILRYPHEMDGDWFWWGRGWCTTEEFRRFCRMEADYLRAKCPGQILFAYTPDRTWKKFGKEGDTNNTFLAYYPGDRYVDILGIDDYSIGHGDDTKAEAALAETVRKLRLMTSFAKERRQVV